MPYQTNDDLPTTVRNYLPAHAQNIHREAFNHAFCSSRLGPAAGGGCSRETILCQAWEFMGQKGLSLTFRSGLISVKSFPRDLSPAFCMNQLEKIDIRIPPRGLRGSLQTPSSAYGLVVFAHGSGSSPFSPRNQAVAAGLNQRGFATLLFDLLTTEDEGERAHVFNIALLGDRLLDAVRWIDLQPELARLPLGLFGASTGAAAALAAAAKLPARICAVVSRDGRPDLAGRALDKVFAPTLLIVGGSDVGEVELNEQALARFPGPKELVIIPSASHLFPEPGALEAVIDHTAEWFERFITTSPKIDAKTGA
jgi:pimeloyl-ACP methyl ester carboxylesterase